MTREFNQQRRDDPRPSSRNQSSNRNNRDEQPSRPARPRLNRETVDRAWEAGAQQKHADYRARSNGQPPQYGRRNNDQPASSTQDGRGRNSSRPHSYSQENRPDNRRDHRSNPWNSDSNRGPHSRSSDSDRRNVDNRQHSFGPRSGPSERPNGAGERRDFRDRSQDNGHRSTERDSRPFRGSDRNSSRNPEQNPPNPRWQSRSMVRPDPHGAQEGGHRAPNNEQFEGDYERFTDKAPSHRPERPSHFPNKPFSGRRDGQKAPTFQKEERHVTRLPDGRVLKGPRPAQRKNAEFWVNVADETKELVDHVHVLPNEDQDSELAEEVSQETTGTTEVDTTQEVEQPASPPKRRTRIAASAVTRSKKTGGGPRPSQRGFKWPAP